MGSTNLMLAMIAAYIVIAAVLWMSAPAEVTTWE